MLKSLAMTRTSLGKSLMILEISSQRNIFWYVEVGPYTLMNMLKNLSVLDVNFINYQCLNLEIGDMETGLGFYIIPNPPKVPTKYTKKNDQS